MPNYQVTLTGAATVVVIDAQDEADAKTLAFERAMDKGLNITPDECHEIPDAELESAKNNADAVSEP